MNRKRPRASRRTLIFAVGLALLASNAVALPASAATSAGWNTVNTLPAPLNRPVALTDGNFLYIAGGSNGGPSKAVWSAAVGNNGVLGNWVSQPAMPAGLNKHAGVLQSGFAFVLGGQSTGAVAQATVYASSVNSTTGTLGAWATTTALPTPIYEAGAVASGGYVWSIGGFNAAGTGQTTVNVAKQTNGTLGAWTTTTALPIGEGELGATVNNGWIYAVGGHSVDSTGNGQKQVYAAKIGANGTLGAWQTLTPLPAIRWDAGVVAAGGYLWAIGGYNSAALATNTTYRAPINSDGTIGAWVTLSPMPGTMAETSLSSAQGFLFEAGSKTASGGSNAIYTAPVGGPWVMLSSYAVNAGASVTASGTGFAANEQVTIAFNGTTVGTASADATGSFGLSGSGGLAFVVPASTATGSYPVTASGQTSGLLTQTSLAVTGSGTPTPTPTNTSTATPPPTPTFTPSPTPTPPPTGDMWTTYLYDGLHHGYNTAFNAFGTSNAASLKQTWSYTTGGNLATNPAVASITGGAGSNCSGSQVAVAYAGSWNGYLYAINANSGALCWKTFLAKDIISPPNSNCITQLGVTSAPTVATVTINGTPTQVVFAGGSDILFALNAQTGAIVWQTTVAGVPNGQFSGAYIWSSPTYWAASNTVYTSTASFCDETNPVDGGVYALNASTGAVTASLALKPGNQPGDGVWGSPTLNTAGTTLYIATGNTFESTAQGLNQACVTSDPLSCAIVALNATTLQVTDHWQAPQAVQDDDFGDTPVVFLGPNGHNWLAVGNKDGYLYVLDTTNLAAGPVWTQKMANGGGNPIKGIIAPTAFLAGTVIDPNTGLSCTHGVLFLAAGNTTLNGTAYGGSISALCADTGAVLWQQGTTGLVWAAPTLANGLLADQQGKTEELRDWTTGQVLFSVNTGQNIYDAATFANGHLYFGANTHALYAFGL